MTHLFLTGDRGVGKSTALRRALALAGATPGGLETYFAAPGALFMRAYGHPGPGRPVASLAGGRMQGDAHAFDRAGVALLRSAGTYPLIVMDELGRLEQDALAFQRAVLGCLNGDKPVLGVIQAGHIPWLDRVKAHPAVTLIQVTRENRDQLPGRLASLLRQPPRQPA